MPPRSSTPDLDDAPRRGSSSSATAARPSASAPRPARNPQTVLLLRALPSGVAAMPRPDVRKRAAVRETRSFAQLERQRLVGLEPQAHRGRDAVVGGALQVFDQIGQRVVVLAVRAVLHVRQPDMLVRVDQGRDDGLAGQVHARGARGGLPLTLPADPGEDAVLDQERRRLDGRAAAAVDEPGPLEPGDIPCRRLFLRGDARNADQRGRADVAIPTRPRRAAQTGDGENADGQPTRQGEAPRCPG